ncbi:MAG TPA: universal stress protein [Rhizobiales bacterium]|nr:universal stress protein [Hyphomicrobiales bacterium]
MYKSILLPVDLGHAESWKKATPAAVDLARNYGAKINVLTVIPDYGMPMVGSFFPPDFAEQSLKATRAELDKFVADNIPSDLLGETRAVHGTIYKRIIINADDMGCDLIVIGSHRPEKADYLLGPNAARVVRHASQSVFVVR